MRERREQDRRFSHGGGGGGFGKFQRGGGDFDKPKPVK